MNDKLISATIAAALDYLDDPQKHKARFKAVSLAYSTEHARECGRWLSMTRESQGRAVSGRNEALFEMQMTQHPKRVRRCQDIADHFRKLAM